MTNLVRGRIYRARLQGLTEAKYFVVVSNNRRNRALDQVLAVRFTTSPKPQLNSIIEVPSGEVLAGRIVCDDIETIWEDEVQQDMGALSPATMAKVENGLRAALGLQTAPRTEPQAATRHEPEVRPRSRSRNDPV